jgi:hypothetical protein
MTSAGVEPSEALAPAVASVHVVVVAHARLEARRAIEGLRAERARADLVERVRAAREGPRELGQVLDRRRPVRPVGLGDRAERGSRLVGHRRQVGIARASRTGRDERQRGDAVAVVERLDLGERPAHRHADDVRNAQAEHVEQGHRVGDEVGARVPGRARRVAVRLTRVAVVVADDAPPAGRQARAEVLLPPVHRRACPMDEHDGGVGRLSERLDAVGADDRRRHRR